MIPNPKPAPAAPRLSDGHPVEIARRNLVAVITAALRTGFCLPDAEHIAVAIDSLIDAKITHDKSR